MHIFSVHGIRSFINELSKCAYVQKNAKLGRGYLDLHPTTKNRQFFKQFSFTLKKGSEYFPVKCFLLCGTILEISVLFWF